MVNIDVEAEFKFEVIESVEAELAELKAESKGSFLVGDSTSEPAKLLWSEVDWNEEIEELVSSTIKAWLTGTPLFPLARAAS